MIFGKVVVSENTLKHSKKGYVIRWNGYKMFFLEVIPVTPNRFRPENKLGDQVFLHSHTIILTKLLQLNLELSNLILL